MERIGKVEILSVIETILVEVHWKAEAKRAELEEERKYIELGTLQLHGRHILNKRRRSLKTRYKERMCLSRGVPKPLVPSSLDEKGEIKER